MTIRTQAAPPRSRRPRESAAPAPSLPLAHRLPNPPAEFVGRAWEREHLRRALTRGRVAVIWGIGGLGKTALALETVHRHFAARVPRTLYVGLQPSGGEDVRARLVRALADAHAATTLDWRALLADPDSLVATAIDLADVGDHWIVIDDLQWTDPAHARHLLAHVARFARRSRWLAISREDPRVPEIAPETLALEAMAPPDLSKLAAIWAPRRPRGEIARAVDSAGGSPWQLRRALFGAPPADTAARDVLAGVGPALRGFVLALARVDAPLALATLARVARVPDAEELAALERRGLIEQGPRGYRLHDVARAMVASAAQSELADPRAARQLAEALVADDDPATALAGVRILARERRTRDVLAALDARGGAWLAAGFAPELWRLLSELPDEPPGALSRWRLRCTVEFDSRDVLAAVDEQRDPSPADRLAWARVLFRRGQVEQAAGAAGLAADAARAAGDAATAVDAALLRAGATAQQGREREALDLLGAISPPDAAARARLDALAAMLLTALEDRPAARERLARLRLALPELPAGAQLEVAFGVVQALYFLGQYREADEVVRDLVARRGEQTLALYHGRRLLYYRACIAVERGQFAQARELLARLEPFVQGRSMFRAFVDYAACMLHLAAGEIDAVRALLPRTIAGGRELGEWNPHHVEALLLQARLALLLGAPLELPGDDAPLPEQGYPARVRVQLHRVEGALRAGAAPLLREAWPRAEACPEWGDTRAIARLTRARAALAHGALDEAREEADRVTASARESGSAVLEAEGWQLRAEIDAARGDATGLAEAAAWLREFGASAPAPRFAAEAELFAVGLDAARLEPAALESIASRAETSPRAARRARALLGALTPLDAFDRIVIAAIVRAWRGVTISPVGTAPRTDPAAPWTPGWGLDARRQEVWLTNGARVGLADRPQLWRLLEVLAERGGRASKEELVCAAWGEREYHPLKHDNRLRLAARKLRQAIEADPAAPALLLTTDDGYALGGAARWLRASAVTTD